MGFSLGVGPAETTASGSDTTVVVTLNGVTAGRSLAVVVDWFHATVTLSSVACSGESNLTLETMATDPGGSRKIRLATLANVTTGGDKTITATFSGSTPNRGIHAQEIIGGDTADFVEDSDTASAGTANPTLSLTTGAAGAMLLGAVAINSGSDPTVGSGFTVWALTATAGSVQGEYNLDAGASGAKTVDFVAGANNHCLVGIAFNAAPLTGDAAFNLPVLDLEASNYPSRAEFNLPVLDLAAFGGGTAAFALPKISLSSAGSMSWYAAFVLPKISLSSAGEMEGYAIFSLLPPTLSATGLTGGAGTAAFPLPVTNLLGTGIGGSAGTAEFVLPKLELEIAGIQNGLGIVEFLLPSLELSAAGATGNYGEGIFELPILTLSSAGIHSVFGSAAFNLPVLFLSAQGAAVLTAAYRTWVLNTRRGALTEYDSFPFNSYAIFNGRVLACGASGVISLGVEALDGAAEIDAIALTGLNDFETSVHKRVPRIYVDGSQAGDMHFKAITVEGGTRTYLMQWNNLSGQTQRRVPVGKGPRSRYWQFGIENVAGADFSTASLMVYPSKLRRRVS